MGASHVTSHIESLESMRQRILVVALIVTGIASVLGVLRAYGTPASTTQADITLSEVARLIRDDHVHSLDVGEEGWFVISLRTGEEYDGFSADDVVAVLERNGVGLGGVTIRR